MNAKTTALILAAGIVATSACADDPSVASIPLQTATEPSLNGAWNAADAIHQPSVAEVILSDYPYGNLDATGLQPVEAVMPSGERLRRDPLPLLPIDRRWVFGITPSPVERNDQDGPANYFPSVTFRFDLGRSHRS